MEYKFRNLTQGQAEHIAYNWHYDGEYSFYDMEADKGDLEEFLNPDLRGESIFAVIRENELIAYFTIKVVENKTIDIGLGMRPDLTGRGKGLDFLKAGLDFVQSNYNPTKITLSVATFNKRAIKVYRKIGFRDVRTIMQDTNGGTYEFLKMELEC